MKTLHTPEWISHRGQAQVWPENTKEAFDEAVAQGFERLETDLRVTRDGHVVLCHDPSLSRLGGPSTSIFEMTRKEVEKVSLEKSCKVLFLDNFISLYRDKNWIFDIKPEQGHKTIEALWKLMHRNNDLSLLTKKIWFLLWSRRQAFFLKDKVPGATLLASKWECWQAGLSAICGVPFLGGIKKGVYYGLPPKLGGLNVYKKAIVARYRKYGGKLIAYLPEKKEQIKAAVELGMDAILTDLKKDSASQ